MSDQQSTGIRIAPGLLEAPRSSALNLGDQHRRRPRSAPLSGIEVVMDAPALATSPPAANRAERRRVARASRKLGQQAAS